MANISSDQTPLLCCLAYWPPGSDLGYCVHYSSAIDSYSFSENTSLAIIGDLNCDHISLLYCSYSNPPGRLLYNFMSDYDLTQIGTEPTCTTKTSISCIDFVLTNYTSTVSFIVLSPSALLSPFCSKNPLKKGLYQLNGKFVMLQLSTRIKDQWVTKKLPPHHDYISCW